MSRVSTRLVTKTELWLFLVSLFDICLKAIFSPLWRHLISPFLKRLRILPSVSESGRGHQHAEVFTILDTHLDFSVFSIQVVVAWTELQCSYSSSIACPGLDDNSFQKGRLLLVQNSKSMYLFFFFSNEQDISIANQMWFSSWSKEKSCGEKDLDFFEARAQVGSRVLGFSGRRCLLGSWFSQIPAEDFVKRLAVSEMERKDIGAKFFRCCHYSLHVSITIRVSSCQYLLWLQGKHIHVLNEIKLSCSNSCPHIPLWRFPFSFPIQSTFIVIFS